MAMTKLEYEHGLFVTNGRISPQAKREYINDYPGLNLDFLDGEELAREVLSHGVLTALWWEGTHFSEVNVSTIFPMIIRIHRDDSPFSPFDSSTEEQARPFFEYLGRRYPKYEFSLQTGNRSTEPFEPYRYPEPLTMEEGALPFIRVVEVAITGHVAFAEFPTLSENICKAACSWLLPEHKGVSVRVGRPEMVPLRGADAGKRILTDVPARSFTATSSFCSEEQDWFDSKASANWSGDSDARVSEGPWIRLYADELDCSLAYEIETRISSARRKMEDALRELRLQGWNASVFCLVPEWEEWPYAEIPEPDETVIWPWDGRILCGWYHWSILGGPVKIRSARDSPSPFVFPDEEKFREWLAAIAKYLSAQDTCQILDSSDARHMVALAGNDPFPDLGFSTVDTADVIFYLETLPSPIRPEARRFRVSVAWRTEIDCSEVDADIRVALNTNSDFETTTWCERRDEYVCGHLEIVPPQLDEQPTQRLLNDIFYWLKLLIPLIEESLRKRGDLNRATRELWATQFNVNFGMTAEESDKCYVGTFNPDGSIEKLNQKTFLEEGFDAAIREREQSKSRS